MWVWNDVVSKLWQILIFFFFGWTQNWRHHLCLYVQSHQCLLMSSLRALQHEIWNMCHEQGHLTEWDFTKNNEVFKWNILVFIGGGGVCQNAVIFQHLEASLPSNPGSNKLQLSQRAQKQMLMSSSLAQDMAWRNECAEDTGTQWKIYPILNLDYSHIDVIVMKCYQ